jgi:imidazolonepropionase-like amidohydrolase
VRPRYREVRLAILSLFFLVLSSFSAFPWRFPIAAPEVRKPIVIKDARVFDGEKVLARATVVIKDGKIASVGEDIPTPSEAEIIEGEGLTLLPGLIDAHVHVWDTAQLRQSTFFGVTAVVDMFTTNRAALKDSQKARQEQGDYGPADFISPGNCVTVPGGHGTQFGPGIPTITGPDEAQGFVDARIAEGSDFIKIMLDDGTVYGMSRPTISNETMAAVIRAAHLRNKLAVIHAATLQNCVDALNAGVDGLAHLYFNNASSPDFGRLAARKRAFVIPTFSVLQTLAGMREAAVLTKDPLISPYLKTFDAQNLDRDYGFKSNEANYRAAEKALPQLKEAGVPILAGTDAPNPGTTFGASLHRELELLVRAGLTPVEALRAATSIPADKFGLEGHGRIKPGAIADLVLVKGDPTQDIKTTRDIVSIWKDGRPVDRQKYREECAKEGEAGAAAAKAPVPEYGDTGLISDFEGESVESKFGAGWVVSTDAFMGGKSKADMKLVAGGAQGSSKSLLITGTVITGSASTWAGVMFMPGATMMAPADISARKSITFWAKGDGKKYACMIFAQSLGWIPAGQYFAAVPEWKEFRFTLESFRLKGDDIMGIFIGASGEAGDFSLQIDNVRLEQ